MRQRPCPTSFEAAGLTGVILLLPVLGSFPAVAPDEFEKGKVIEKVVCRDWAEMKRLDADLDGTRMPHRLLFYEAPHQWPDVGTCDRAVGWMEIMAMRQGPRARDDSLIDEILGRERQYASGLLASGKIFWAARQYEAVSRLFADLRDTAGSAAEANRLERSREYAEFLNIRTLENEKDLEGLRKTLRVDHEWAAAPQNKGGSHPALWIVLDELPAGDPGPSSVTRPWYHGHNILINSHLGHTTRQAGRARSPVAGQAPAPGMR